MRHCVACVEDAITMSFVGLISGRVRGNTMRDDYAQVSGKERDCKVY